mmetsp:Transcript_35309/g.56831  ORF Transcript_35309/g.56831 Transcript_35309/m.56831 type:complete len:243 (+) Transcript_35309:105-833(+)
MSPPSASVVPAPRPCISFLAVSRMSDAAVLAARFEAKATAQQRKDFDAGLRSMAARASKLAYPGWRGGAEVTIDSQLFALLDNKSVCLLVVGISGGSYPDRLAYQLLGELAEAVLNKCGHELIAEAKAGQFASPLAEVMRDLIRSYNEPAKIDRVLEVHQKVDSLKFVMQDNVRKILETHASLESLEQSSSSMTAAANRFLKQSANLKQQLQLRNLKVKVITACCISAVVAYMSLPLISSLT